MSELSTAARPYAKAVFEMAHADGEMQAWSDTLSTLAAVVSNDDMRGLLESPAATAAARADAVCQVCGDSLGDKAKNVVRLMAENDRLSLMPEVARQYETLRSDAEGTVEADVRTAMALTDEQAATLAEALGKRLSRTVKINSVVDESLLGGAIIQAGDLVIDGSIRGKLEKLGQALNR
ncbi:MAG: F0F1 ATP synthase subunit delta [Pseudomonadota bacterium]